MVLSGHCDFAFKISSERVDEVLNKVESICSKYRSDREFEVCQSSLFEQFGEKVNATFSFANSMATFKENDQLEFETKMEYSLLQQGQLYSLVLLAENLSFQTHMFSQNEMDKPIGATVVADDFFYFRECKLGTETN